MLSTLCGMPKATYNWKFCCVFFFFFYFLLSFLSPFWPFLIIWSWRIAGWGCCFRGWVFSVLPCFQIPAYFLPLSKATAVKQREACGECAPKMLKWITSTSLHSNQTCLWLWAPWGTPFFPQEFSLSPFLCISECDLYLRADRFRTGFVWSHILAPVVVRGRWRVIGSAWIFGGFFYCATALSLQTKWMGPRAAGLRGAVATSSGWLVWSGFHEMGYFMS